MTKYILFIVFIIFYSCSSDTKDENKIDITGSIRFANNNYIFLERLTPGGFEKVDSCSLDGDQQFELSAPSARHDIYRINFFGIQKVSFVPNGHDVHIKADGNNPNGRFEITGSSELIALSHAHQLHIDYNMSMDLIDQKLRTARNVGDTIRFNHLLDSMNKVVQLYDDRIKNIVYNQEGNLTGLLIMSENLDVENHLDVYSSQIPGFEQNLEDHWYFKQVKAQFQNIKKLAVGSIAPGFTLPDTSGNSIALSSLRGKFVFLDFWASWCQPCRRDNPKYVSIYNEYKNQNFEILGVSFDRKRENWLKAIKTDQLDWLHVSDLKYFDSEMIDLYNIVNVPTTFLLDPDGRIIAKNVHPEELEKILVEVL